MHDFIIACLYFVKLVSSYRFVSREFHNFGPPIVIHVFCSHIKLLKIFSLSSMHLAILIYKQIIYIFGSKFKLALYIHKPVLYFNKSNSFNAFNSIKQLFVCSL